MESADVESPERAGSAGAPRSASARGARTAAAVVVVAALGLLAWAGWDGFQAPRREGALTDADRRGAADAVRLFLTLSAHLRTAGGDPRFAERLPASDEVVDEVLQDITFLRHAAREEEARLVRSEVRDVRGEGDGRATVRTKEYWVTRELTALPPALPQTYSDVVLARYAVRRETGGWRVESWRIDMDGDGDGGAGPPPVGAGR